MRKKDFQQKGQVHHQEDAVDPGHRGVGSFGANIVKPISALALTELAFYRDSLQVFCSPLCF